MNAVAKAPEYVTAVLSQGRRSTQLLPHLSDLTDKFVYCSELDDLVSKMRRCNTEYILSIPAISKVTYCILRALTLIEQTHNPEVLNTVQT